MTKLSPVQDTIINLLADGYSQKECATSLNISIRTVQAHCERIKEKLQALNLVHAVALYARRGLLFDLDSRIINNKKSNKTMELIK